MRCEFKACPQQAILNSRFCSQHQPARPINPQTGNIEDDVMVISVSQIPAARTNEVAVNLLNTLKTLSEGKALKVSLAKFRKPNLACTQRYALSQNLRIGVRYVGQHAYLWKMNAEEVKAAEQKAQRLASARAKKGRRAVA